MPKKSTTARGGAQRNKPKVQKNFELVRPTSSQVDAEQDLAVENESTTEETDVADTSTSVAVAETTSSESSSAVAIPEVKKSKSVSTMVAPPARKSVDTKVAPEVKSVESASAKVAPETKAVESASASGATVTAPKGSAAAKVAARRQASQKAQQRAAATLITAEHYSYVRRDLVFIAILAVIMFGTIIILHFVPGIGS